MRIIAGGLGRGKAFLRGERGVEVERWEREGRGEREMWRGEQEVESGEFEAEKGVRDIRFGPLALTSHSRSRVSSLALASPYLPLASPFSLPSLF
jgi:hypothetical protein